MVSRRTQIQLAINRGLTRVLARLGLREQVFRLRKRSFRLVRRALEARGVDRLSRPAAHGLDGALDRVLDMRAGFFVEAGAHDGYTQSNTYWLERFRGWRGILIEPMPELVAELRRERPAATIVQAALVAADFDAPTVRMRFGDLMSTVEGTRIGGCDDEAWAPRGLVFGWKDGYEADIPARTLSSVLDEAGAPEIDLLSLDVEGYEANVLRGLDLERHAPRCLVVEMQDAASQQSEIEGVLAGRYELAAWLTPVDALYVRSDARHTIQVPRERSRA